MKQMGSWAKVAYVVFLCIATAQASGFEFSDFTDIQGLKQIGSAKQTGARVRLTDTLSGYQTGAIWHSLPCGVSGGFTTVFKFEISQRFPFYKDGVLKGEGGDGFAFVLHNDASVADSASGNGGDGFGYNMLFNALAVEFDTYFNATQSDPNNNHIGIHSATSTEPFVTSNDIKALGAASSIPKFTSGIHTVKILYTKGSFSVFLDDTANAVITANIDLDTLLSLPSGKAWFGFTAGTGEARENHDIISWKLNSNAVTSVKAIPLTGYSFEGGVGTKSISFGKMNRSYAFESGDISYFDIYGRKILPGDKGFFRVVFQLAPQKKLH